MSDELERDEFRKWVIGVNEIERAEQQRINNSVLDLVVAFGFCVGGLAIGVELNSLFVATLAGASGLLAGLVVVWSWRTWVKNNGLH